MKRNRNITQEALDEAWRQKQLRGEPGNIVFVDGIAWEHTDLTLEELARKYNAILHLANVMGGTRISNKKA